MTVNMHITVQHCAAV